MANAINWFELPVVDLERARRFYEAVLGTPLRIETFNGIPMAIFRSAADGSVGGALIQDARMTPSEQGALVYLNATGTLDACLRRVEAAGGKVVAPKTDIGDPGFIAVVVDTEGNRVGLHDPLRRAA